MKKTIAILCTLLLLTSQMPSAKAAFGKTSEVSSKNEVDAQASQLKQSESFETGLSLLSVEQILSLSPSSYHELTGQKMSFKQKVVLKYIQRNMAKDLQKNGSLNVKDYVNDGEKRFSFGGLALGFFLGLIGVGIAYLVSDERAVRKSAWFGFGLLVTILGIALSRGL